MAATSSRGRSSSRATPACPSCRWSITALVARPAWRTVIRQTTKRTPARANPLQRLVFLRCQRNLNLARALRALCMCAWNEGVQSRGGHWNSGQLNNSCVHACGVLAGRWLLCDALAVHPQRHSVDAFPTPAHDRRRCSRVPLWQGGNVSTPCGLCPHVLRCLTLAVCIAACVRMASTMRPQLPPVLVLVTPGVLALRDEYTL